MQRDSSVPIEGADGNEMAKAVYIQEELTANNDALSVLSQDLDRYKDLLQTAEQYAITFPPKSKGD